MDGLRVNQALPQSLAQSGTKSVMMAGQAALGSSMSRIRFKSIALCATVGIGLLLVFVGLLFAVEQRRTQAEAGAVLSALFSQEVLHDMDKWGPAGRTIEIVIQRRVENHCACAWLS
jgi:hypothetical protein